MLRHLRLQPDFFGDIALDPEVADDTAVSVVQADVVAFDVDGRAVDAPLVGLDVQLATVEELAPHTPATPQVVLVECRQGSDR